jgi:hypothetical protein
MSGKKLHLDLDLLLQHQGEFIKIFSESYPLSKKLLEKYAQVWDWYLLSRNLHLPWDIDLIEQFKNKWQWYTLGRNTAVPWNEDILERFKDQWDWNDLSHFPPITPLSPAILRKFEKKWWWVILGRQEHLVNNPDTLKMLFDHLSAVQQEDLFKVDMPAIREENYSWAVPFFEQCPKLNWKFFSCYRGFPWTKEFIRKHAQQLDWKNLSGNEGLPWDMKFIQEHEDKWDWKELSRNKKLPWTKELLKKYAEQWDWQNITGNIDISNEGISWNAQLLEDFADKICWAYPVFMFDDFEYMGGMINHPGIVWTAALYEKCDPAVSKHFKKLKKEYEKYFEDEDSEDTLYWTYYQNGKNWSVEYLKMLMKLSQKKPGIQFIDWDRVNIPQEVLMNKEFIEFMNTSSDEQAMEYCFWKGGPCFFEKYADKMLHHERIWDYLSLNTKLLLHEDMLKKYEHQWNWKYLASNPSFTPELIKKFQDRWKEASDWRNLSLNPNLTLDIIEKFKDKWDWKELSTNPGLTQEIICRYADKWDWENLCKHHKLTFETLERIKNHVDWWWAFNKLKLNISDLVSEDLLEKFLRRGR